MRQLLEDGQNVIAVARRKVKCKGVEFIQGDIQNVGELEEKLKDRSFDYILHLASLPGDTGKPKQMVDTNVNGCLNMMELARMRKVKRMVIASSISAYEWYPSTVFQAPDYLPVDERHPCRPRDMYSTTKRIQELLAMTYYHQYHLPVTCLRFTAVIGPDGRGGGRGWREIAELLAEGKSVRLPHFSAKETCHYVDIRDAARMVKNAALCNEADGEIFNCCGPCSITGEEFAAVVKNLFSGIEVEFGYPWSMAQGGNISFSMEKAKRMLNFIPIYSVEDSMRYIKQWIEMGGLKESNITAKEFGQGITKTK